MLQYIANCCSADYTAGFCLRAIYSHLNNHFSTHLLLIVIIILDESPTYIHTGQLGINWGRCLVQRVYRTGNKSETVSMRAHTHTHSYTVDTQTWLHTHACALYCHPRQLCSNQKGRHCCRRHSNSGCSCRLMHMGHMHASCVITDIVTLPKTDLFTSCRLPLIAS